MRRAGQALTVLCVVVFVVALCGCGGSGGPSGSTDSVAKKPPKPPSLPPPGDASGVLTYFDVEALEINLLNWDGSNHHPVPISDSIWYGFDLCHTGPAGRFFAYGSPSAGDTILVVPESGGSGQDIINDPDLITSTPALSPDGTKIAFDPPIRVADLVKDGAGFPIGVDNIEQVCIDGYTARLVLSWSPDGDWLAFADPIEDDIYIVSTERSTGPNTPVNITNTPDIEEFYPCWCPDDENDRIAFTRQIMSRNGRRTQRYDIYTIDPENPDDAQRVTSADNTERAWNWYPAWSPDGSQIAFTSATDRYGNRAIFRTKADGSSASAAVTDYLVDQSVNYLKWRP